MQHGTISNWNEDKGFGFIISTSGGKAVFTHIKNYSKSHHKPFIGLEVQYMIANDSKGRMCAIKVVPLTGHKKNRTSIRHKYTSIILLLSFTTITIFLFNTNLMPLSLLALYAAMSSVTYIIYAKDKSAAQTNAWRTSESTLHTLSLLGGWPGATIAQIFLRHKTNKVTFKVTHWLTIAANCGIMYWLVTP